MSRVARTFGQELLRLSQGHPDVLPAPSRDAQAEIGPVGLKTRGAVYALARDIAVHAQIAAELAVAGPGCDVARARAKLDQIRAMLGPGPESGRD
ncbi:hypothetical protein [Croceicoccus sp. BE223]|uniref:hypothetical protein n=1 Tax=Croceicoccus sp. BE223 TaxID=2817716 RepID=UPI00285E9D7A|nr:hypothetical protein [Croceicoccus sp. BE223]MDR7102974.1 hypothetical protein [Croceicoccus sp. BE223]